MASTVLRRHRRNSFNREEVAGEEGWVVDLLALYFVHALVLTTIAALIGEPKPFLAFPVCDDLDVDTDAFYIQ